jgi:regulator of sirC expression with transglutaminase-like and TPR domain
MDIDAALTTLAADPHAPFDLAELALWLARDEYPELDVEAYLGELAGMAHEVTRYLKGGLEARVNGLCRYLFHDMGFRGNKQNYSDPRNSYLNQVLDRRTGIPIALSAVAIAVGTRAELQIVGVGLPGHFVAKAVDGSREILFDPFHGGRLLTVQDCENLIEQVTGSPFKATPTSLEALPLRFTVLRMLNNLKTIYVRKEDFNRSVRVIERIRQLDPDDALQQRDLGVSLLQAGQPGRAIDHLSAYLVASDEAVDSEPIRQLLERARGEVSKWN